MTRGEPGEEKRKRFPFPEPLSLSAYGAQKRGARVIRFLGRGRLRPAFVKRTFELRRGYRDSLRPPDTPLLLVATSARGLPAASAAGDGGGALRSAPARSGLRPFAVQLRPRFGNVLAGGVFHLRSIQAGCVSQRFVRRLATGPAVLHSARGACFAHVPYLVCGPSPIAKQPLLPEQTNLCESRQLESAATVAA